jgi:2-dehydro-3-deoxygalactonokinase
MRNFLSCDWGTSSFRIRLADSESGEILAEEISTQGIANTFALWTASAGSDETNRTAFYMNIIDDHIKRMEAKLSCSLKGVKIIASGMASSNIGIINIPYSPIPLDVHKPAIQTAFIPARNHFDHDVWILSGIRSDNDVARGEETQLIGCIDPSARIGNELFIFPGTHSKHIYVKENRVVDIKTFMTGELFELLSEKSILSTSVEKDPFLEENYNLRSFKKGVDDAVKMNLLNSIFKVRTNDLLQLSGKNENYSYLSGLLIGTELRDLKTIDADAINLVSGSNLASWYNKALLQLGLATAVKNFPAKWVDEAAVRGQLKIANHLNLLT